VLAVQQVAHHEQRPLVTQDVERVAVSIGAVSAFFTTGAPGEISTAPMATLPLLLIPAFLVPLFLMLHTAALMQSRQLIRSRS
jgi:hypothetical protein